MKIEKISDERIKVTLLPIDMKKWNITYETLSADSPETNEMVWDIILKIAEETGVDFKNCRLSVEVVRTKVGNCVLIISKKDLQTRYKYRRKDTSGEITAVYRIADFDDLINFAKKNLYYCFLFDGKNSLYRYKNDLLLVINVSVSLKKHIKQFNDQICEYADFFKKPELYAAFLDEHYIPVIRNNALKILYYRM